MSEYPGDQREADERAERTNKMLRDLKMSGENMRQAGVDADTAMRQPSSTEPRGLVAPPRTPRQMAAVKDDPAITVRLNVEELLISLGQDITREGLKDTPARVAKFYAAHFNPEPVTLTSFQNEGISEMIVQSDIPFYSLCEHHMVPFFGTATVAYIPGKRIVGLSKLARLVQYHAAGLQNQERITSNVAEALEALNPLGVGVLLSARHLCMEMRGSKVIGAHTTTSKLTGVFREATVRAEFLSLAR